MKFTGASAVVTGGASGLGESVVRSLASRGVQVVIADVQKDKGDTVAQESGSHFVSTDVTSEDQVIAAVDRARELGELRVLVNCAGFGGSARIIGRDGTYESAYSLERYTRIITTNLIGTFNCMRIAATAMSTNEPDENGERGAIVNTASVAAFDGQIGQVAYSASKGGIVGMTLPAARDLAPAGIRVNAIAPGLIDTPIYNKVADPVAFKEKLARDVVFPARLGQPEEFAALTLHLLENTYMNGEVVRLDAAARLRYR
ncbi:SDR family NAD(P)-dependent oxidoreductase [Nocardia sp. NPDC059239]|uniref:SDR family NAD(P)-dependent oxidoreductase n=1 Tax=unclassified Nocardia TaxID=2637762 RepID=UPI0036B23902